MTRKKLLVFVVITLLLGSGGFGIYKILKPPKPEFIKITIAQPEQCPDMMPHYMALKNGFFKEVFATVSIKTYDGDQKPSEALARGEADLAVMDLADFLFELYKNADLIAIGAVTAAKASYVMAREDMPGFSWTNMQGKTIIGDTPESSAGILLEMELRKNQIPPYRQVSVYYNVPQDLKKGAFKAEIAAFLQASEPMVSELELEETGQVVASLTGDRIPAYVYVTNSSKLQEEPEKYQRFANGLHKGFLWMEHHPDLIYEQAKSHFRHIDDLVLKQAVSRYIEDKIWPQTPLINQNSVEQFHDMAIRSGELPGVVEYSKTIDNRFAQLAVETVEYIPPEEQKKGLMKYWPFE